MQEGEILRGEIVTRKRFPELVFVLITMHIWVLVEESAAISPMTTLAVET